MPRDEIIEVIELAALMQIVIFLLSLVFLLFGIWQISALCGIFLWGWILALLYFQN